MARAKRDVGGERTLWSWLLAAAPPDEIGQRQVAVDELAARRDWRETLAIEGALTTLGQDELPRFLEWAESQRSAVPPVIRVLAVVLPITLAVLLALYTDRCRRRCLVARADGRERGSVVRLRAVDLCDL